MLQPAFTLAIITFLTQCFSILGVDVTTESELNAALLSGNTINFDSAISLTQSTVCSNQGVTGVCISAITGLIINGNGWSLDGNGGMRCIGIVSASTVTVKDMTIKNGYAGTYSGGGIYVNGASSAATLSNVNIENCQGFISNL